MPRAIDTLLNQIKATADYYKLHGKEADYQDLKNVLDEYQENLKKEGCLQYNKLGIEISGKLMVFRKVTEFQEVLRENGIPLYRFKTKIIKNHDWVIEPVECEGRVVFRQG
jgi:hypothetical protein